MHSESHCHRRLNGRSRLSLVSVLAVALAVKISFHFQKQQHVLKEQHW